MNPAGAKRSALREDQIQRYARHILLPDVGGRGQERLLAAAVEVELGAGRAAEATALAYLAAAGVGRVFLTGDVDGAPGDDEIAGGILYGAGDRERPRGVAARERIAALNPDVSVIIEGAAPADALRLADQLEPGDQDLAGILARAGAAAARVLLAIARRA